MGRPGSGAGSAGGRGNTAPAVPAARRQVAASHRPRTRGSGAPGPGTALGHRDSAGTPGSSWHHWHSAATPASSWHHLPSPWHCSDTDLAPLRSHPNCLALPWHCQAPPGSSGHRPGTSVHCPDTDLAASGAALHHCSAAQHLQAPSPNCPGITWQQLSSAPALPWHHCCIAPALTNRFRETLQDLFISLHIINTNTVY